MTPEREQDKLREKARIPSEENKAKDQEAKGLTSERGGEILERKVTMEKAKKEMW